MSCYKNKRIYSIWHNMKTRCYNENTEKFKYYGGKGISVCDEWRNDYKAFETWALSNGYEDSLEIDRIDSKGNYEPSNCRWSTRLEQNNNTSKNKYIEHNGKTKTIAQWAREFGIERQVLNNRIKRGWDFMTAVSTEVRKFDKN